MQPGPIGPSRLPSPPTREVERRAQDTALARQACGQGCGCLGCRPVADDPLAVLEALDREVRRHEDEHLAAAGELARSGPILETVTASNGRSYAVAGRVLIDVSEVPGDPRRTVEKMKRVQKAALAPDDPSSQDRRVAAEAAAKQAQAERELAAHEGWLLSR
jgi:hypothetical protein